VNFFFCPSPEMPTQNLAQQTATDVLPERARFGSSRSPRGAKKAVRSSYSHGSREAVAPGPKQILIVEDDPQVRELVAVTVTQAGFQADTAQDGEEGWTALCVTNYDLVITDNEMPRLTGLKLIERLREISIEPPCILISGNLPGPESVLRRIVHRGEVMAKPFSRSELMERVYGLLTPGEFQM
jgi:CheY-like chemotaxis protein